MQRGRAGEDFNGVAMTSEHRRHKTAQNEGKLKGKNEPSKIIRSREYFNKHYYVSLYIKGCQM
jgi:hypothetical protein